MIVILKKLQSQQTGVVDLILEWDTSTNVANVLVLKTDRGTCPT